MNENSCLARPSGGTFNSGLLASLVPSISSSTRGCWGTVEVFSSVTVAFTGRPATGTAASTSTPCTATFGFGVRLQSTMMMGIWGSGIRVPSPFGED